MSKRSIILRKVGSFYQIFDDDALIISYFFNYKIINYKCGFPISAIEKVSQLLEKNTINYIIKQDDEVIKDYKGNNNYDNYLEKAKEKNNLNIRIEKILDKLMMLEQTRLNEILELIENELKQ